MCAVIAPLFALPGAPSTRMADAPPIAVVARTDEVRVRLDGKVSTAPVQASGTGQARKPVPARSPKATVSIAKRVDSWFNDHGWYSLIGPQIEEGPWHSSIDFRKSYSDEVNLRPRQVKIPLYGCPDDGLKENEWAHPTWARVRGNYVVNAGNTDYGQATKNGVAFRGAPFTPRLGSTLASITDGTSKTLMTSEVIATLSSSWWGGSISDFTIAVGGQTFTGWFGPNSSTPDEAVRDCPQPSQYNGIPGCTLTYTTAAHVKRAVMTARSKHVGGVTVSMCDGSVHFVSDSVDLLGVWRPMTSASGGEAVSP